ncbi:DivIVA domain-containing protein [Streptosporangium saharense]|uniref:DivIVA domain-containing protein n=1 Tax=Streptosporangium saharense TaxID=1706840 RepID=UPI003319E284
MSEGCREPGEHEHPPPRLLTPHDVRSKVFPTVRLREGYDLAEVDTFLGEVEFTLRRVLQDKQRLSVQLAACRGAPEEEDGGARVLARAQRAAEVMVAQAEQEALTIVAEARTLAAAVEREAFERATALEREVRERHRQITHSLDAACTAQQRAIDDLGELVDRHGDLLTEVLDGQVEHLRDLLRGLREQGAPEPPRLQALPEGGRAASGPARGGR